MVIDFMYGVKNIITQIAQSSLHYSITLTLILFSVTFDKIVAGLG
jgi:hypothetical protein